MLKLLLDFSQLLCPVPHTSNLIFVLCNLILDSFFFFPKGLLPNQNLLVIVTLFPLSLLFENYLFRFHLQIESVLHRIGLFAQGLSHLLW